MGIGFIAYVTIGLSNHSKAAQKAFENDVMRATEVTECHNVTGANEYLLRVETRDLNAYKHFHTDILGDIANVNAITIGGNGYPQR